MCTEREIDNYFLVISMKITHDQFLLKQNDIILRLAEMYGEVMHLRTSKEFENSHDFIYMKCLEEQLEKIISLK